MTIKHFIKNISKICANNEKEIISHIKMVNLIFIFIQLI